MTVAVDRQVEVLLLGLQDHRRARDETAHAGEELADGLKNWIVDGFQKHVVLLHPTPGLKLLQLAVIGLPIIYMVAAASFIDLKDRRAQSLGERCGCKLFRRHNGEAIHHKIEQVLLDIQFASPLHDVVEFRTGAKSCQIHAFVPSVCSSL